MHYMNNKLLLFRILGVGNFSFKLTVECSSKVVLGPCGCGGAVASTGVSSETVSSSALTDWGAVEEGLAAAGDTSGTGDGAPSGGTAGGALLSLRLAAKGR